MIEIAGPGPAIFLCARGLKGGRKVGSRFTQGN